jgi:hypothetical protein
MQLFSRPEDIQYFLCALNIPNTEINFQLSQRSHNQFSVYRLFALASCDEEWKSKRGILAVVVEWR